MTPLHIRRRISAAAAALRDPGDVPPARLLTARIRRVELLLWDLGGDNPAEQVEAIYSDLHPCVLARRLRLLADELDERAGLRMTEEAA